jgi:hypothetical protein
MRGKKVVSLFWIIIIHVAMVHCLFAIGVITGTVYYRGPKHGEIHVEAYDNPDFQGSPMYWVMPNDTGPYRLGNVADGVYWIAGYMDADSNGVYTEPDDPSHFRDDSVIVQGDTVSGIDLMLDYYPSLDNPPFLLSFHTIKLSPSMQSTWSGSEDYLCYSQVFVYHKWGPEYIDSVYAKTGYIPGWNGRMEDDGLHWDENPDDSVWGRYHLADSTEMLIWLSIVDFWLCYAGVVYTPWPAGMEAVWARPALEGVLSTPILIEPAQDDTITTFQPDFVWNSNSADWYEVIVWDTMPMPNLLGEHIVWRHATSSGNDTTLSMNGDPTQLEHGTQYYWAVIGYEDPPYGASAIEWSWFTVDTSLIGITENDVVLENIELLQNIPNPFSKNTVIVYHLQHGMPNIELTIYDATGRIVRQWDDTMLRQSDHVIWDGTDMKGKKVPSGIYFYTLEISDYRQVKKLLLLR